MSKEAKTRIEAALSVLADKQSEMNLAKATIEAELREELNNRLYSYRVERDRAARVAYEVGASKASIGRHLGTKNYASVSQILESAGIAPQTDKAHPEWSVERVAPGKALIRSYGLGDAKMSGSATIVLDEDGENFSTIDGDAFIEIQLYKLGFKDQVIREMK